MLWADSQHRPIARHALQEHTAAGQETPTTQGSVLQGSIARLASTLRSPVGPTTLAWAGCVPQVHTVWLARAALQSLQFHALLAPTAPPKVSPLPLSVSTALLANTVQAQA